MSRQLYSGGTFEGGVQSRNTAFNIHGAVDFSFLLDACAASRRLALQLTKSGAKEWAQPVPIT